MLLDVYKTKAVKQFFDKNQIKLESYYPGINFINFCQQIRGLDVSYLNKFFIEVLLGRPFAYINGETEFYGSSFFVGPKVFIPRQETEILVQMGLEAARKLENDFGALDLKLVDVCTGSGNVILSMMRNLPNKWKGLAIDQCSEALCCAKDNYVRHEKNAKLQNRIEFRSGDRLYGVLDKCHLIVSNPPYIKTYQDRDKVHENVLAHEPEMALFLEDHIYDEWFETFFTQCYERLYSNGILLLEGHEFWLDDLSILARKVGFVEAEVLKDLSGAKRFLKCCR